MNVERHLPVVGVGYLRRQAQLGFDIDQHAGIPKDQIVIAQDWHWNRGKLVDDLALGLRRNPVGAQGKQPLGNNAGDTVALFDALGVG